ncbi:MAG TPA: hypothetical protein VF796_26125, partial [Humisphaera sp.]
FADAPVTYETPIETLAEVVAVDNEEVPVFGAAPAGGPAGGWLEPIRSDLVTPTDDAAGGLGFGGPTSPPPGPATGGEVTPPTAAPAPVAGEQPGTSTELPALAEPAADLTDLSELPELEAVEAIDEPERRAELPAATGADAGWTGAPEPAVHEPSFDFPVMPNLTASVPLDLTPPHATTTFDGGHPELDRPSDLADEVAAAPVPEAATAAEPTFDVGDAPEIIDADGLVPIADLEPLDGAESLDAVVPGNPDVFAEEPGLVEGAASSVPTAPDGVEASVAAFPADAGSSAEPSLDDFFDLPNVGPEAAAGLAPVGPADAEPPAPQPPTEPARPEASVPVSAGASVGDDIDLDDLFAEPGGELLPADTTGGEEALPVDLFEEPGAAAGDVQRDAGAAAPDADVPDDLFEEPAVHDFVSPAAAAPAEPTIFEPAAGDPATFAGSAPHAGDETAATTGGEVPTEWNVWGEPAAAGAEPEAAGEPAAAESIFEPAAGEAAGTESTGAELPSVAEEPTVWEEPATHAELPGAAAPETEGFEFEPEPVDDHGPGAPAVVDEPTIDDFLSEPLAASEAAPGMSAEPPAAAPGEPLTSGEATLVDLFAEPAAERTETTDAAGMATFDAAPTVDASWSEPVSAPSEVIEPAVVGADVNAGLAEPLHVAEAQAGDPEAAAAEISAIDTNAVDEPSIDDFTSFDVAADGANPEQVPFLHAEAIPAASAEAIGETTGVVPASEPTAAVPAGLLGDPLSPVEATPESAAPIDVTGLWPVDGQPAVDEAPADPIGFAESADLGVGDALGTGGGADDGATAPAEAENLAVYEPVAEPAAEVVAESAAEVLPTIESPTFAPPDEGSHPPAADGATGIVEAPADVAPDGAQDLTTGAVAEAVPSWGGGVGTDLATDEVPAAAEDVFAASEAQSAEAPAADAALPAVDDFIEAAPVAQESASAVEPFDSVPAEPLPAGDAAVTTFAEAAGDFQTPAYLAPTEPSVATDSAAEFVAAPVAEAAAWDVPPAPLEQSAAVVESAELTPAEPIVIPVEGGTTGELAAAEPAAGSTDWSVDGGDDRPTAEATPTDAPVVTEAMGAETPAEVFEPTAGIPSAVGDDAQVPVDFAPVPATDGPFTPTPEPTWAAEPPPAGEVTAWTNIVGSTDVAGPVTEVPESATDVSQSPEATADEVSPIELAPAVVPDTAAGPVADWSAPAATHQDVTLDLPPLDLPPLDLEVPSDLDTAAESVEVLPV